MAPTPTPLNRRRRLQLPQISDFSRLEEFLASQIRSTVLRVFMSFIYLFFLFFFALLPLLCPTTPFPFPLKDVFPQTAFSAHFHRMPYRESSSVKVVFFLPPPPPLPLNFCACGAERKRKKQQKNRALVICQLLSSGRCDAETGHPCFGRRRESHPSRKTFGERSCWRVPPRFVHWCVLFVPVI